MANSTKDCRADNHDSDGDDDGSVLSGDSELDKRTMASTEHQEEEIAAKESREIKQVKLVIFAVLAISTIGAVLVYLYTKHSENRQFELQFHDDATKVLGALGASVERSLRALDSLVLSITTTARLTNQTFPFVTIPYHSIHFAKTQTMVGGVVTYLLPVVTYEQRHEWEHYAAGNNTHLEWFNDALRLQENWSHYYGPRPQKFEWESYDVIHSDFGDVPANVTRPLPIYLPGWQKFPLFVSDYYPANWDWYSIVYPEAMTRVIAKRKAVLSQPLMIARPDNPIAMEESKLWCEYFANFIAPDENCMEPMSNWYYPIIDNLETIELGNTSDYPDAYNVSAMIAVEFYWRSLIKEILPPGSKGIILVFENPCVPDTFTYQIDGPKVKYLGVGDFHDHEYDHIAQHSPLDNLNSYRLSESVYMGLPLDQEECAFTFHVYPSDEMKNEFETNNGIIFALSAVAFIVLPFLVFLTYDRKVARQKQEIMSTAKRSNDIVSSLFPSTVRDKLYPIDAKDKSDPIADLYPETTVLFADIVNFTAWSSVRDPYQVFTLLEGIYGAFDECAKRRRVFKVETIGDCYVAVAGLPEPRRDHAVVMTKFASEILREFARVTSKLGTSLGPGTSSLTIRIGLNSGPTTAGVLRGEKGRFQVFGDTVNTAARMESNSNPGRILCSQKTADCLIAAGKGHWVTPRPDLVDAKGKGTMQCFWCLPKASGNGSYRSESDFSELPLEYSTSVDWMAEMFEGLLKELVSSRSVTDDDLESTRFVLDVQTPRDEVSESIVLPQKVLSTRESKRSLKDFSKDVELSGKVKIQLYEFIASVAGMYRDNPFHNFEHASHVVMATMKLLSRVIKPNELSASETAYGITSDPLTHFAVVFSALIHDVDHPGVSNAQLVKEKSEVAVRYKNLSVAEQNSVSISWELLMQERFVDLRQVILPSAAEGKRFRQLIVNSVLATDLFDADLKRLRENRWQKAFDNNTAKTSLFGSSNEDSNRRATIVIEHIIQASDVSHTMQHWHVYQEWNGRLLQELYNAYLTGRAEKDPTAGWYEGELWFFDNYIIPLAKKLKTCGVFGVSCDELLDYATENRNEWAAKGRDIVANHIAKMKSIEPIESIGVTEWEELMA